MLASLITAGAVIPACGRDCNLGNWCQAPVVYILAPDADSFDGKAVHGVMQFTVDGAPYAYGFDCEPPPSADDGDETSDGTGGAGYVEDSTYCVVRSLSVPALDAFGPWVEVAPHAISVRPPYLPPNRPTEPYVVTVAWEGQSALTFSGDLDYVLLEDPNGPGCGDCYTAEWQTLSLSDGVSRQ